MLKAAIFAGMLLFALVVMAATIMIPDTTERSAMAWLASTAEASKTAAIRNSPEMRQARAEIERLSVELQQINDACPAYLNPNSKGTWASMWGLFGW
jgi:hypothetical protein